MEKVNTKIQFKLTSIEFFPIVFNYALN